MQEFVWLVRVYYEDTDAGGVVYYANYLKFMERARTEWLRSLGYEQDELLQQYGILFAVRQVEVRYHSPARFNEALEVSVEIKKTGRASLNFIQEVRRCQDSRVLCNAEIMVACVDAAKMRPVPIPKEVIEEIVNVE